MQLLPLKLPLSRLLLLPPLRLLLLKLLPLRHLLPTQLPPLKHLLPTPLLPLRHLLPTQHPQPKLLLQKALPSNWQALTPDLSGANKKPAPEAAGFLLAVSSEARPLRWLARPPVEITAREREHAP